MTTTYVQGGSMKTKLFILSIVILALLTSCGSKTTTGTVLEKEKIIRASGEHINIVTLVSNDEQKLIEVTSTHLRSTDSSARIALAAVARER